MQQVTWIKVPITNQSELTENQVDARAEIGQGIVAL